MPEMFISDKAANIQHAWKEQYRDKNILHKNTEHVNDVVFDGIHHSNQMKSFN